MLDGAHLHGARLLEADLEGAYFDEADLTEANLRGALLRGADLRFTNLHATILQHADLEGVNMEGAQFVKSNAQSANMTMAILYHAVLDDADLRDARLHNAVLIGARGRGTIFTKADLTGIYAPAVALHRASFNEAQLEGQPRDGGLAGIDLQPRQPHSCQLTGGQSARRIICWSESHGARLHGAHVRHTVFHGTNLRSTRFDSGSSTVPVDEFTTLPPNLIRPAPCTLSEEGAVTLGM